MKSLIFTFYFALVFQMAFAILPSSIANGEQEKEVPEAIMKKFTSSFVMIDGKLLGAKISHLKPYLSNDEITALLLSHLNKTSSKNTNHTIYLGYKPKSGACKKNTKWACVLHEDN